MKKNYPAMIILLGTMLDWTYLVEKNLKNKTLNIAVKKLKDELDKVIIMVRGDLSEQERMILGSMVYYKNL
jgi:hypothetical protein